MGNIAVAERQFINLFTPIIPVAIIAIVLTVLVSTLSFFNYKSSDGKKTKGKGLIIWALWINVFLKIAKIFVSLIILNDNDFTNILNWFVEDFTPIVYILIFSGMISSIKSYIQIKVIGDGKTKELDYGETVALTVKSLLPEKIEKICKLVTNLVTLLFAAVIIYDSVDYVIYKLYDSYIDVRDIYSMIYRIPYCIITPLYVFMVIKVVATVWTLLTENVLTVTNKRVLGTGNFYKKINIPLENITNIVKNDKKGITISVGYEKYKLSFIDEKESDKIISAVEPLIEIVTADKQPNEIIIGVEPTKSSADFQKTNKSTEVDDIKLF